MSIRSLSRLSRFVRAAWFRSARPQAPSHRPPAIAGAMFALLLPLGASATVELPLPEPTLGRTLSEMCGNEPMPILEAPYAMRCALDFEGVAPNLPGDQGDAIRAALASLVSAEAGLFFPQGRYLVGGQLTLRTGNVLVGSRSGVTHFINPAQETSIITQHLHHSAHKILVEGLVLDNIAVQFFHSGGRTGIGSVLRYTGIRGTTSPSAQIALLSGANQVLGNVLWREPGHPGIGIQAREATGSRITGNVLGAAELASQDASADVDATRVRRLTRVMSTLVGRDGTVPNASEGKGHFSFALMATRTSSAAIDRNTVQLTSAPLGATSAGRQAARLMNTTTLSMTGNRFVIAGEMPARAPTVTIGGAQSLEFVGNRLERVALHIVRGAPSLDWPYAPPPTKSATIRSNWFVQSVADITQRVTGDGATDTTINDLSFIDNHFDNRDLSACMLSAPTPTAPGRTFLAVNNQMSSGTPAKLCNLRGPAAAQP